MQDLGRAAIGMQVSRALGAGAGPAYRSRRRSLPLLVATAMSAVLFVTGPASAEPADPEPSEPAPSSPPTDPGPSQEPIDPPAPSSPPTEQPVPSQPSPANPPAEPPPLSEQINAASTGHEALAADAIRLSRLVFVIEEQLSQLELEAKAAADVFRLAEADLAAARAQADATRLAAVRAALDLSAAQHALESFARESYVDANSELVSVMLLLDAHGPRDLIDRAGLLNLVADSRTHVLDGVLAARATSESAEAAAAASFDANVATQAQARSRLDQSTAILAEHEARLPTLLDQRASAEATFYSALVRLLGPVGAVAAFAQYEQDQLSQHAAEAAARAAANGGGPVMSGSWALPVLGRFTSCFCSRWGTMHWGIDIAAPMYTPEYAAGDGVVVGAGPASGFGQAVYIQHDNGDVTVYGHMAVIEVVTGQRVSAGQEIALLGSQGFSTGPHLHFEVHVGGMGGPRVDPVLWLAERGIYV